jgi:molecular chaperone GrpE
MAKKIKKEKNTTQKAAKKGKENFDSKIKELKEQLEEKEKVLKETEEQISEWKDKHHRLYAEFDNYRRRTLKEKADLIKTASEKLILEMLPVLDDFERAIKAKIEAGEEVVETEGMSLIYNKMKLILEKQGAVQMKSMGEEFDPEFHEAIAQIPAPKKKQKGKILDVVENGFLLNDKVIRFAKVVVGV